MYRPVASLLQHTAIDESDVSLTNTVVRRGAGHMLSEKSQRTPNGTMFVDLDCPVNASRRLLASAELLVIIIKIVLESHTQNIKIPRVPPFKVAQGYWN